MEVTTNPVVAENATVAPVPPPSTTVPPRRSLLSPIQFWVTLVMALGFCVLVWPTIYRYDHMTLRDTVVPVRIHRLSGDTEYFYREWRRAAQTPTDVPAQVISGITGRAGFQGNYFRGNLYNPSNWSITEVTIRVSAKDGWGTVQWTRDFTTLAALSPRSAGDFTISTGEVTHSADWQIVAAKGREDE